MAVGRPARPRAPRRLLAAGALLIATVWLGLTLFGSGSSYEVTAVFDNAGQLVVGNQVLVGSIPVGSVEDIRLNNRWQAEVVISVATALAFAMTVLAFSITDAQPVRRTSVASRRSVAADVRRRK
jgi:ABC-type transporter Mla subunit MlaD